MAFLGAPARGEDLPPVTVTDTRLEAEEGAASPGCVTILRPEEVRGEAKTVADLLEQSAGVHVVRLRGRGNYTVALVRGSTAAQVAVYLDGTLVNSAGESAVDLSTLPVESVEPRLGLYAAVTRADASGKPAGGWLPGEKLTAYEALRGFTLDAAYAGFAETEVGSLEVGKRADFVILAEDPLAVPDAQLRTLHVRATYVDGKPVYAAPAQ